jgi:hypothetical protein
MSGMTINGGASVYLGYQVAIKEREQPIYLKNIDSMNAQQLEAALAQFNIVPGVDGSFHGVSDYLGDEKSGYPLLAKAILHLLDGKRPIPCSNKIPSNKIPLAKIAEAVAIRINGNISTVAAKGQTYEKRDLMRPIFVAWVVVNNGGEPWHFAVLSSMFTSPEELFDYITPEEKG